MGLGLVYLTNLPGSYPRWSKDFSFGRLAVECIFSYLKLLRKVAVFFWGGGAEEHIFGTMVFGTSFFLDGPQSYYRKIEIILLPSRTGRAQSRKMLAPSLMRAFLRQPNGPYTSFILIQELLQLTIVIFLVIFGEQHSCIFLLIWLGDIEEFFKTT